MQFEYELKLQHPYRGATIVTWVGRDGADAAKRFLSCCDPTNAVIAYREVRHGVYPYADLSRIID